MRSSTNLAVDRAQRVTGGDVLQTHRRGDITGEHFLDLGALVGVHLHHAADTLLAILHRVVHAEPLSSVPEVDAEEGQRADEGVGGDLERQRRERRSLSSASQFDDRCHPRASP
jgi:hypothetical protein